MINRKIKNLNNPLLKLQTSADFSITSVDVNLNKKIKADEVASKLKKIFLKNFSNIFKKLTTKKLMPLVMGLGIIYSAFSLYSEKTKTEPATHTLIKKVGKLILLPDTIPKVFKVSNVDTLKAKQLFFVKAENDDTVLVYADEIILYRESINKIINLAPVSKNKSEVSTIQNNI